MKEIKKIILLAIYGTMVCLQAQAQYKDVAVLESSTANADSCSATISQVYSIGDSIIILEGNMYSYRKKEVTLVPISPSSVLKLRKELKDGGTILSDSCELKSIVTLDPKTKKPTGKDFFGMGYWENMEINKAYPFWLVYKGKLTIGNEYLEVTNNNDERWFHFENVKIDNSIESRLKTYKTARPTSTVNVRQEGTKDSPIICKMSPSNLLVVECNPLNKSPYCKVIILSSGKEGYVHKNYLKFGETLPKLSYGALKKMSDNGGVNVKPTIQITNNSIITINLNISGKDYVLKPKGKRTVTANPGVCYIIATGSGCSPYYGADTLLEGGTYSWTFVTRPVVSKGGLHF